MNERPSTGGRYVAIHGHFYQPPRENPWLEAVEVQDSAAPYHDWNERVTAECYAPNTAARRVAQDNCIIDIVNNFEKISFNIGPTLLSWLDRHAPHVYQSILRQRLVSAAGLAMVAAGDAMQASRALAAYDEENRIDAPGRHFATRLRRNLDRGADRGAAHQLLRGHGPTSEGCYLV